MIRVLVVAAIRFYREGLSQAFSRRSDLAVVGSEPDVEGATACLAAAQPDVVLVDAGGGEPLSMMRALATLMPGVPVVALGIEETSEHVVACAEAGAVAYVPRDASLDEVADAVVGAVHGEQRCTPAVAAALLRHIKSRPSMGAVEAQRPPVLPHVTPRERQIIGLIERGLSNKEIAGTLGIEVATAKNHVHNILEKLGAGRRAEAGPRLRRLMAMSHACSTEAVSRI